MKLIEFLRNTVIPYLARRDNPHQVTADQVNTYTKAVIDSKLGASNVEGRELFPLYAYGVPGNTPINMTVDGLSLTIDPQPTFIYGVFNQVDSITLTFSPNNVTYVVLEVGEDQKITYHTDTTLRANTPTRITVGRVVTDASTVSENGITNVRGVYYSPSPV